VPLEETCIPQCLLQRRRTELEALDEMAADGGVHAPREQAQGVCGDLRGPHSPQGSRKSHAGERRDRVAVQVQVPTRKHQVGQRTCHNARGG